MMKIIRYLKRLDIDEDDVGKACLLIAFSPIVIPVWSIIQLSDLFDKYRDKRMEDSIRLGIVDKMGKEAADQLDDWQWRRMIDSEKQRRRN